MKKISQSSMNKITQISNDDNRRGSVLVLVAGILVLLVIIATAYLSRTRSERLTATAVQNTSLKKDRSKVIANQLAREIAEKLFPRPIHSDSLGWRGLPTENPNFPKLAIRPSSNRYDLAKVFDNSGNVVGWWNNAPYSVSPLTNWPDSFVDPFTGSTPRSDDVPGNPGTSDGRIFADTEPARFLFDATFGGGLPYGPEAYVGVDGDITLPDTVEVFTHWLHMSNPMRPGNGWIVVPFINDIEGAVNFVFDPSQVPLGPYGTPFEQWLPHSVVGQPEGAQLPNNFDITQGKSFFPGRFNFDRQWREWFENYEQRYYRDFNPPNIEINLIPSNYYKLSDCGFDLDGVNGNSRLEVGERPQDEFIGPSTDWPDGTPRWNISRVLTDTDGDGYTDSFWYLAPSTIDSEIRTLVGVRVVDASAMLNVNVATQFVRGRPFQDGVNFVTGHGTRGWTPADLAMYERADEGLRGVGLLGNPEHWESYYPDGNSGDGEDSSPYGATNATFHPEYWDNNDANFTSILKELGRGSNNSYLNNDYLAFPFARMDYWRRSGSRPFDPIPPMMNTSAGRFLYTPFTMADELELRAFHGSNMPWNASRLEKAFQREVRTQLWPQILRGNLAREETSTYLDELDVRATGGFAFDELLHDMRRHITTHNGARNETMHPSLWWRNRWSWGNINSLVLEPFFAQQRLKLDLRTQEGETVNRNNAQFLMHERLPWYLLTAFSDGSQQDQFNDLNFYYGSDNDTDYAFDDKEAFENRHEASGRAAAGLAANILSFRNAASYFDNNGNEFFLPAYGNLEEEAVRVPLIPRLTQSMGFNLGTYHNNLRFLGMEAQPFLVEAFISHFYDNPTQALVNHPGITAGDNVICAQSNNHTIVVVQIANPYDQPIDFSVNPILLSVFEQDYQLTGSLAAGEQKTYWSIDPSAERVQILDALDIQDSDGPIDNEEVTNVWSRNRSTYDGAEKERAIEIKRIISTNTGTVEVVIDRIDIHSEGVDAFSDDFTFGEVISDDFDDILPSGDCVPEPGDGTAWDVINIGQNDRWMQWVRVSRDWERDTDDTDGDGEVNDQRRNPRYVFSLREVSSDDNYAFLSSTANDEWFGTGSDKPTRFMPLTNGVQDPNGIKEKDITPPSFPGTGDFIELNFPLQMLQKDGDFERIGEILDVFMFGHMLTFTDSTANGQLDQTDNSGHGNGGTVKTFSEFMIDGRLVGMNTDDYTGENVGRGVNRLRVKPAKFTFDGTDYIHSNVVGFVNRNNPNYWTDKRQAFPDLPAGARLLDMFVCDAEGFNARYIDANGNGIPAGINGIDDPEDLELLRFRNAADFAGKITPGLLNITTTPREVLQSLPNAHRFVHETDWDDNGLVMAYLNIQPPPNNVGQYTAGLTRLANAIEVYRDRLGDVPVTRGGNINSQRVLPMYSARGLQQPSNIADEVLNDSRGGRGFESIGEIGLLDKPGRIDPNLFIDPAAPVQWNDSWRTSFGGRNPLRNLFEPDVNVDLDVSTDLQRQRVPDQGTGNFDDETSRDSEEVNMLLSGISNMITTRSDVFVVYFKIRSVRKDPATGIWDGTNLEQIVDDSRYVMVVDRSEVNRVTDQPRILLLEKLPN